MGFYRYYAIIITDKYKDNCAVAPLVGAWIEIMCNFHFQATAEVAPLVGAWIVFLIGQVGLFLMLLINIL